MGRAGFADLSKDRPEEGGTPGLFTDGVYAASPMILDSANADMLAFADRYRARYGREPSWEAAQGYDAINLLAASVRATFAEEAGGSADLKARRESIPAHLASLNAPATAMAAPTPPHGYPPPPRSPPARAGDRLPPPPLRAPPPPPDPRSSP